RERIVRQLLTEVALLSFTGAALGLGTFAVLVRAIESVRANLDVTPSWPSIAFTLFWSLFASILAGLSPALHAVRHGVADALKASAAGATKRSTLQRAFVT